MDSLRSLLLVLIVTPAMLKLLIELLNRSRISPELPDEFVGVYDSDKYRQSQLYLRHSSSLSLVENAVQLALTLALVLMGGFALLDHLALQLAGGPAMITAWFFLMLLTLSTVVDLPFSWYITFVLEASFGFNRTNASTFIKDVLKKYVLSTSITLLLIALIAWLFSHASAWTWLWAWLAVAAATLLLQVLVPVVIMPLFNKFEPLDNEALQERIEIYAAKVGFGLKGIFKIDGSRRSNRGNAFFAGLGKWKRIALFDTLIEKHSVDELECVLAHEVGHYKLKHILKSMLLSVAFMGLMLFLFSRVMLWEKLALAAGFSRPSFHAGLVAVGYLAIPLFMFVQLLGNALSRTYEFEADAYAGATTGRPEDMISALKRLAVDNLVNLTPHPLKVAMEDRHPPILQRIRALRKR